MILVILAAHDMLNRILNILGRKRDSSGTDRPPVHHGPKVIHSPIAEDDLDPDAVKIIRRLVRYDHTAYLVGGCVRDVLLDRKPKDFDIGTSATPRQVKRVFRNCRIIGRRFRLAHIYFQDRKIIEVATFRAVSGKQEAEAAGEESPSRDLLIRDDNVFGTPEEDALRRDFTINQLFYDLVHENIIDHADGLGDLRRKFIRTIGDPEVRFREDPIRILRAIKFAARLDFTIEEKTLQAIRSHASEIPRAAPPRVLEEIHRFFRGGAAGKSFDLLRETGVFQVILPEFAALYEKDPRAWEVLTRLLETVDRRVADGAPTGNGEVLTLLALPLLFEQLGWSHEGTARWPRGADIRKIVDDLIRPMALRLRVARKDQEFCRTLIMTLFRMVPHEKARPGTRKAIPRRPCFPDALRILHRLGEILGNEFEEAARFWDTAGHAASPAESGRAPEETQGRRTRKRPPRQRRKGGETSRKEPPGKPAPNMPSPWSDNYFFAALPSVPEGEAEQAGPPAPDSEPENEPETETGSPARRKRRRRRRKRKPAGNSSD